MEEKYKQCGECEGTMPLNTLWCVFCRSEDLKVFNIYSQKFKITLGLQRIG